MPSLPLCLSISPPNPLFPSLRLRALPPAPSMTPAEKNPASREATAAKVNKISHERFVSLRLLKEYAAAVCPIPPWSGRVPPPEALDHQPLPKKANPMCPGGRPAHPSHTHFCRMVPARRHPLTHKVIEYNLMLETCGGPGVVTSMMTQAIHLTMAARNGANPGMSSITTPLGPPYKIAVATRSGSDWIIREPDFEEAGPEAGQVFGRVEYVSAFPLTTVGPEWRGSAFGNSPCSH